MIFFISFLSIFPFPSMSYIVKAHSSFLRKSPLEVTLIAIRNSLKSEKKKHFARNKNEYRKFSLQQIKRK